MGLDIYFTKRKYNTAEDADNEDIEQSEEIYEEAYFRKVNFLVSFFEKYDENLLESNELIVSRDMVDELISTCNKVSDNHSLAEELLPNCEGFFFGSTDYDEWYFKDVQQVIWDMTDVYNNMSNYKSDEFLLLVLSW